MPLSPSPVFFTKEKENVFNHRFLNKTFVFHMFFVMVLNPLPDGFDLAEKCRDEVPSLPLVRVLPQQGGVPGGQGSILDRAEGAGSEGGMVDGH